MTRLVIVGDPHVTSDVSSLEECGRLIDFIIETAKSNDSRKVVFLGDLFHNFGIVNLAVQDFWRISFDKMRSARLEIVALVGNHDRPGDKSASEHALQLYQNVTVVDKPMVIDGSLYMPFVHDEDEFVAACHAHSDCAIAFVHAEFRGSAMDNGFYSPTALDLSRIPQNKVISGHIHTSQTVGKCWFPGSPRWKTVSDANKEKAIYVIEVNENASDYKVLASCPTNKVCVPIYLLEDTEENPVNLSSYGGNITVDIHGTEQFISKRKVELESQGVRVRTFPISDKVIRVKESDGLIKAFGKFMKEFQPKNGTDIEVLVKLATERISWLQQR